MQPVLAGPMAGQFVPVQQQLAHIPEHQIVPAENAVALVQPKTRAQRLAEEGGKIVKKVRSGASLARDALETGANFTIVPMAQGLMNHGPGMASAAASGGYHAGSALVGGVGKVVGAAGSGIAQAAHMIPPAASAVHGALTEYAPPVVNALHGALTEYAPPVVNAVGSTLAYAPPVAGAVAEGLTHLATGTAQLALNHVATPLVSAIAGQGSRAAQALAEHGPKLAAQAGRAIGAAAAEHGPALAEQLADHVLGGEGRARRFLDRAGPLYSKIMGMVDAHVKANGVQGFTEPAPEHRSAHLESTTTNRRRRNDSPPMAIKDQRGYQTDVDQPRGDRRQGGSKPVSHNSGEQWLHDPNFGSKGALWDQLSMRKGFKDQLNTMNPRQVAQQFKSLSRENMISLLLKLDGHA
jgi:hypothetical protein